MNSSTETSGARVKLSTRIKISEIKIPKRYRTSSGDINSLKESIKRLGLLHPIGVTENNELVYGFRRLQAVKSLGWEEIPCTVVQFDSFLQRVAEVEENINRKDMTWQEEVKAKVELHRLYQQLYGTPKSGYRKDLKGPLSESEKGWGLKETAEFLNESIGRVSEDIKLAKALEEYPELSREKNKSRALRHLRELERGKQPKKRGRKKLPSLRRPRKRAEVQKKTWKCDLCRTVFSAQQEKLYLELCPECYSRVEASLQTVAEESVAEARTNVTMEEWLRTNTSFRKKQKKLLLTKDAQKKL